MKLYRDYNASTPLDARVLDAMTECLSGMAGNPSSAHQFGRAARARLDTAREQVAAIDGETLLMQLDRAGIAVSSGSACSSGKTEPSHVLMAMGVDAELARAAIRISLGSDTREADIDFLLAALGQQVEWVQKASRAAGW